MDWSTSAFINNSPLARRLPGQRTPPPDPTIQQAHAADLTYGWHTESSLGSETETEDEGEEAESSAGAMTRQREAAQALRRRRRERRAASTPNSEASSSSEGSIVSFNSATGGEKDAEEKVTHEDENVHSNRAEGGTQAGNPNLEHDTDSFICRICFDGPGSDDEGGETLGKLIAPCRCRGTMKVSRVDELLMKPILMNHHVNENSSLCTKHALPDGERLR